MANQWFETVAIAQQRAKKRLPASSYGAIVAGAEAGVTMRDNVVLLRRIYAFSTCDVLCGVYHRALRVWIRIEVTKDPVLRITRTTWPAR